MKKNQSGNVLIFILIAIFLLGGLTVLLSRTGSQSDDTGSIEQLSLQASSLLKYSASMQSMVNNLKTAGCSENDLNFQRASADGYTNANSPTNKRCHLFDTAGAGMTDKAPDTAWLDSAQSAATGYALNYYTSYVTIAGIASSSNSELLMVVPYIKKELCSQINKSLGVSVIPQDNGMFTSGNYETRKFTGAYTATETVGDDTGLTDYALISGKKALCIQAKTAMPVTDTYQFYQVLLGR